MFSRPLFLHTTYPFLGIAICKLIICVDYHIDWKPKPYPCTKAEREAAAKRYNLLPSDYKPFENDGLAPGDYFYVEPYNTECRSPWEPYDYPSERRDFNDPQQFDAQLYLASGYNPAKLKEILKGQPVWYMLFKTFAPLFGLWFCLSLGQMYCFFFPLKAKQYPHAVDKENHYTFEKLG